MKGSAPTESELKIPVADLAAVRSRLEARQALRRHPAEREVNILLDTTEGEVAAAGRVLRLRRVGDRQKVTLKGPATFEGLVKSREELEIDVSDLETLAGILDRLGFAPVLRYEKDREEWIDGQVTVALDHTPMGDFVELEGDPELLADAARSLGLDAGDAVQGSYPWLWRDHRERHPELDLPRDMVFPE